jgi:hypothetical protein
VQEEVQLPVRFRQVVEHCLDCLPCQQRLQQPLCLIAAASSTSTGEHATGRLRAAAAAAAAGSYYNY